jgi:hypothetical protein
VLETKVPEMGHTGSASQGGLGADATVKTANGEVKSGQQVYKEGRS